MLTENQNPQTHTQERRVESHQLIKDLISTRTGVLTIYSRLAESKPFVNQTEDDDVYDLLEEFCEVLIDYTANAHFRLYRFIDENKEKRQAVYNVANQTYPRIREITQTILDFNDKYDPQVNREQGIALDSLEKDLSALGVLMAERIDLEDKIIEAMSAGRTVSE